MISRIMARITVDESCCWIWTGAKTGGGYGHVRVGKDVLYVHRVLYEHHLGPIGAGLQLDHLCRVRHCANPEHLEPVTQRENILRSPIALAAIAARKTHCPQGHTYDETNTYRSPKGRRYCRACQRMRYAVRREK